MKFSANLGFLWKDRSLPDAIRAAKTAGFDAVECHWPYDTPVDDVNSALNETGLAMLGLNTRRSTLDDGQNGLAALPDRVADARASIDEALRYAEAIGTRSVHVMAGFAHGTTALDTFTANLSYACTCAEALDITILIEPLNRHDAPGYFLQTTDKARAIIAEVDRPNLKLMFDCYHVGRTEGDIVTRLKDLLPIIGHIQFASVPDRGTPDHGEINFAHVFAEIDAIGWDRPVGAEYKPVGVTSATLDWMQKLRP